MILSGARGVLEKIDVSNGSVILNGQSGRQQYDWDRSMASPVEWNGLLGKKVDLQLLDFLVIDITESSMSGPSPIAKE